MAKIPQVGVKLELDDPPTLKEIKNATMQLKVGKSSGTDGIPAEVYQHGGEAVLDKLQDLFTSCLETGTLPQDLIDAVIVSLYKKIREKNQSVHTIEASPCSTLQAKSWLASCWIVSSWKTYQKACVCSDPTDGQQT